MRIDYVRIIASLKFILKKPVYAPSIEKEQCHHLMEVASKLSLDVLSVRNFMRVLCKISREIQRKMHVIWSLDQRACVQFLLNHVHHIPTLQLNVLKSKLRVLDDDALFFCEQLIHLVRFSIRFIDIQVISLFSLTNNFSLNYIREKFDDWQQLSNNALLYKLFLLMNRFLKKEEICS
ncbi:MAG: hypothetical protein QM652_08280 [Legionella sp.]|uniref:hypothetical protein n=1 Tax=Legionella sp. TaxID=459 RepID=UPI0039E48607